MPGIWRIDSGIDAIKQFTSEKNVAHREKEKGGSGGSLEPPGPLLTHLRTVCVAYSGCLSTLLSCLAERTTFSQVALFSGLDVFTAEECAARQSVLLGFYVGVVEMECLTMIDMINQHVIPAASRANLSTAELAAGVETLEAALAAIHHEEDEAEQAALCRVLRLETMAVVRVVCDATEASCPADLWTLATYKELLFLDCPGHPGAFRWPSRFPP